MKKFITISVFLLSVVAIFATSKIVGKANEDTISQVESEQKTEDNKLDNEDVNEENEDLFTYRLYVDKMDMYTYNKGHDGEYTIEYSVNGGEVVKKTMGLDVVQYLQLQPMYFSHYVDVENVKEGDVVNYSYSFYNTYLFPNETTPAVVSGSKVVQKKNS